MNFLATFLTAIAAVVPGRYVLPVPYASCAPEAQVQATHTCVLDTRLPSKETR